MGIIDIVLLIIIGVFAIKGLFRGLIGEVFGILGLILGYLLAYQYYQLTAKFASALGFNKSVSDVVGFVITFIIIYTIIIIISIILKKFFKKIQLGWADKLGGFLFGALKSSIILALALSFLVKTLPPSFKLNKDLHKSPVAKNLLKITPYVFDYLNKLPKEKKRNPFRNIRF
ncbi:colicin V production protein [Deferribacter desulfuricans SSM1]|uniref:Colicin V production protein n=1 Tax=Deferribacter desulfuricans (strain DSM 14783 / JCM 11476 / NBRC 101012 / SSM1) TaxID=639282 RepID=D3P8K3_DEFDS|nr:CvpA family protein [Deferribacter desulfuricans]BAI81043.1 colicin V production protein [Deferribacter desulfuricans SSM1]